MKKDSATHSSAPHTRIRNEGPKTSRRLSANVAFKEKDYDDEYEDDVSRLCSPRPRIAASSLSGSKERRRRMRRTDAARSTTNIRFGGLESLPGARIFAEGEATRRDREKGGECTFSPSAKVSLKRESP